MNGPTSHAPTARAARPGLWLAVLGVVALAALNGHVLTQEIDTAPIPPPDAAAIETTAAGMLTEVVAAAPVGAYPESLARPLFRASRRPPEPEKPAPQAATPRAAPPPKQVAQLPEGLELIGIMKDGDRAGRALIRLGGATGQWVEVGHMLQGWRLSRIEPGSILFETDGRQERLTLFRPGR
jgi:general secretion pathway protein N